MIEAELLKQLVDAVSRLAVAVERLETKEQRDDRKFEWNRDRRSWALANGLEPVRAARAWHGRDCQSKTLTRLRCVA